MCSKKGADVLVVLCLFLLVNFVPCIVGANVHAETATKDTAITYACANGHTNVAALLLDYGADLVCAYDH